MEHGWSTGALHMNTEKDPKKDPDLSKKETKKGEIKGKSLYISKRTGLTHRRIHISIPEMVYRDILEEIEREYGKQCPRKISELLIRAFYYYKNKGVKEPETLQSETRQNTKPSFQEPRIDLNEIFSKIPQTERLKEKLVRVLYQYCIDRIKEQTSESIEKCVLEAHQMTSTQLESSIIKAIGHDPRTIESNVNAFIKSGLLLLQTQNPERNIKIYTITMNGDERKEYLAKILSKPSKPIT